MYLTYSLPLYVLYFYLHSALTAAAAAAAAAPLTTLLSPLLLLLSTTAGTAVGLLTSFPSSPSLLPLSAYKRTYIHRDDNHQYIKPPDHHHPTYLPTYLPQ